MWKISRRCFTLVLLARGIKELRLLFYKGMRLYGSARKRRSYCQKPIHILDWYHEVDNLWKTAYLLFGDQNKLRCEVWVNPYKEKLWDGKVDDIIKLLVKEAQNRKINQIPIM
ncbi:MAG: hypothetical protein SVZ03_13515 [Spirochaetota bacterium]|nr:hypothetical protein [Spirochaetota bacterium]